MSALKKLAEIECKRAYTVIALTVIITLIIGIGIANTRLQTDLSKEMPQDLNEVKLNNKLSDTFGGQDAIFILVSIDKQCEFEDSPKDIRSRDMMVLLSDIDAVLRKDSSISDVRSPALIFSAVGGIPQSDEGVKTILENVPASKVFFNRDNTATFMVVSATVGSSEEKINSFTSKMGKDIDRIGKPSCVKIVVTGNPSLRAILIKALQHDLFLTMGLAASLIFILVAIVKKSVGSSALVMAPLLIGIIWTLGILGWTNTPLSIATAGLGAMLLGLGTEYGIFMYERYKEERLKGYDPKKAMSIALPSVGSGIIGSGLATVIGFLALVLTPMPMIQNLGKVLALGILCITIATILCAPSIIVAEEEVSKKIKRRISLWSKGGRK